MLYLARHLTDKARHGGHEAPILVVGFRSSDYVPKLDFPEGTVICTDDGSVGFKGTVVDLIERLEPAAPPVLYACGPGRMCAALDTLAAARNLPFWVAAEQWMACGVGACMGCALRLKTGEFLRACADGPVFDGRLIDWEACS
jgi:dihydroorotate dehydrogenase electron transfer subunit